MWLSVQVVAVGTDAIVPIVPAPWSKGKYEKRWVVVSPCGLALVKVVERCDNDASHRETQIWPAHFTSSILKHKSCPFHLLGMSY